MATKSRRPKHEDVLALIQECIDAGRYLDTRHAHQRRAERQITRPEMLLVLRSGRHEKRKDVFKSEHNAWTYAVRGKTVDERELRVCVSFDEQLGMLIITTTDLGA